MRVLLQRRLLCSSSINAEAAPARHQQWWVKQVTKSNFAASAEEMSAQLSAADFVAVSLQKTGSFSAAPWHRPLPFDTPDAAYSKAKSAAERFHLFQLALCPFSLQSPSTLLAHPYNYLLFPRDEQKLGLPAYSFAFHSSHLTSMAKEGFDFNACVNDGLSYMSRAQESSAVLRMNKVRRTRIEDGSASLEPSVADSVFVERIRNRIVSWKNTCKKTTERNNDTLIGSLGKIIMSQFHGNRPSTEIDVCSEHQVQLTLRMLSEFSDDLAPLIVPAKSGGSQSVRVVFMSSKEDKKLFEEDFLWIEEKERKQLRGFREVIDLVSASQKPVVSFNSLTDFAFIYSKFIGPLPPTIDEFSSSLREAFPNIVDVRHLMKSIGPLSNVNNIPVAISFLNSHYSVPVDVQISQQETENGRAIHGHNVVRICHLFAKLCLILKISQGSTTSKDKVQLSTALEKYTNVFHAFSSVNRESTDKSISVWTKSSRKASCDQLVFLWGFGSETTARKLKSLLHESHHVFTEEFDVRLVDRNCAVVVFWKSGLAETFLDVVNNCSEITGSLREIVSDGLRAASYDTYLRACKSTVLGTDLGESLDNALEDQDRLEQVDSVATSKEIYWCSDDIINFNEL